MQNLLRPLVTAASAAGLLAALLAVPARAASPESGPRLADVSIAASGAEWKLLETDAGTVLTVRTPGGEVERIEAAPGSSVRFSPVAADGSRRPDGNYVWEIRPVRKPASPGKPGPEDSVGRTQRIVPADGEKLDALSGSFSVSAGLLVFGGADEVPSAGTAGSSRVSPASTKPAALGVGVLDQVIADDLIVTGSGCFGFDCVNNESFGFDTLRLKENNLQIKFEDTSATAGFPTNDWLLRANDSASGGANRFVIEDTTGAKIPLSITAGAPTSSVFVDTGGRVGFRTATPVLDLHANTGNTPALRLEQNGSAGWSAQTWDVAANEANFFIRDVTGGSKLPFRIQPGAPTNSIYIANSGNVGLGTTSPVTPLHILKTSEADVTVLRTENTAGRARMDFVANGELWFFQNDSSPAQERFNISLEGSGGVEVQISQRLDADGLPTMKVDGSVQATNVIFSSSRELKTAIAPLDQAAVLERVAGLPISEWRYKSEAETARHVGPMAEDFASAFELTGDGRTISMVDANGVALASIQALYAKVREKDADIEGLRKANLALMARLAAIEESLGTAAK